MRCLWNIIYLKEVFMEYHLPKGFNEVFDLGYKAW